MTTEKLRCRNVIGPRAGDSSAPLRCARNDNGEATLSERHWFKGARFLDSAALGMTTEKLCCRNVIGPRAGDSSTPLHSARNDNGCLSSRAQRCPSHHERSCPRVTPSAAVPESFRAPLPPGHSKRSTSSLSFRVERSVVEKSPCPRPSAVHTAGAARPATSHLGRPRAGRGCPSTRFLDCARNDKGRPAFRATRLPEHEIPRLRSV